MIGDETWEIGDSTVHEPSRFEDLYSEPPSGSEAGPDPEDAGCPTNIGRYKVLGRLGRGGMGEVFLALDESLSRKIALKMLRPDQLHRPTARRRFEVEAKVTAMLQHPSILPVYHYDDSADGNYYTMRPVEGITCADLVLQLAQKSPGSDEEWPVARLVRLFLQAANAVAFAHSRGVIHRDLKSANIMVGNFEEVLVLDWGMAKVLGGPPGTPTATEEDETPGLRGDVGEDDTGAGYVLGTPLYMAPERLAGGPATFVSDVFSLGCVLYELLALRSPWAASTVEEILDARSAPPVPPDLVQRGRRIPAELGAIALKAIEYDPARRFASVSEFSRAVSHVLEGRPTWRVEPESVRRGRWQIAGGKVLDDGGDLVLRSSGPAGRLRYFCQERFTDNLRVEFELNLPKGSHELSVWLNRADPRVETDRVGYSLLVIPGGRHTVSMLRSGRVVAGAKSPPYDPRRWYATSVLREDDRISLRIEGEEVYAYVDPIPLQGGFVGLSGQTAGLRIRGLRVYSRGTSARVSCLAIPDALYNRRLYEDARAEYHRIAASHPGRDEGWLATFRAGLCPLEMARGETDAEMRALLLAEADDVFARSAGANDCCLTPFGRCLVALERGDTRGMGDALQRALDGYPGDPHLPTVREWLVGRIHALTPAQRRAVADLLPVAISHCTDSWGRQLVGDLVRNVRQEWECPSFLTSRSRFRDSDPLSHAEARLFFSFWSSRTETVEEVVVGLLRDGRLRPHHVSDGVLALLELGRLDRAERLLDDVELALRGTDLARHERLHRLCRAALVAARGDPERSVSMLAPSDHEVPDRVYNAARLWLSRAHARSGDVARAFKVLRPLGANDGFARERQAWLCLEARDPVRAERLLEPCVVRSEHRSGKNLSNFLLGVACIMQGRHARAETVFSVLESTPWPRTWTLGSHYALGRLGGGRLESYLEGAFFWERIHLREQALLLALAQGQPPDSLPRCLQEC